MAWTGTQRRGAPRTEVRLDCTLTRRTGNPVIGSTLDVGTGGMRVACRRPLSVDEQLAFALMVDGAALDGHARVVREDFNNVYALRFVALRDDVAERIAAILN